MFRNHYAADATEGSGAGAESTANGSSSTSDVTNDASGKAAEATQVATTSQTTTTDKKKLSDVVAARVAKANAAKDKEVADALTALGVELPEGESPLAVLASLGERLKVPEQTQSELDKLKGKYGSAEKEKLQAQTQLQDYVQRSEMRDAINAVPGLVPGAIPDIHKAFLADHKIRSTADGVRVYDAAGQIMYTEDGVEMTTAQALAEWLSEKSYYMSASVKTAATTAGNMRGTGGGARTIGYDEAQRGGVSPEDLASGNVKVTGFE
jgi:hypothetical protein